MSWVYKSRVFFSKSFSLHECGSTIKRHVDHRNLIGPKPRSVGLKSRETLPFVSLKVYSKDKEAKEFPCFVEYKLLFSRVDEVFTSLQGIIFHKNLIEVCFADKEEYIPKPISDERIAHRAVVWIMWGDKDLDKAMEIFDYEGGWVKVDPPKTKMMGAVGGDCWVKMGLVDKWTLDEVSFIERPWSHWNDGNPTHASTLYSCQISMRPAVPYNIVVK